MHGALLISILVWSCDHKQSRNSWSKWIRFAPVQPIHVRSDGYECIAEPGFGMKVEMVRVKRLVGFEVFASFFVVVDSGSYRWAVLTKPEPGLTKRVLDILSRGTVRDIDGDRNKSCDS